MAVQSLEADKGPFGPMEEDEKILGAEVPIKALMYLANCTISDIAFVVTLLARYIATQTKRHWVGIKTIIRYMKGTQELML
jgi:hypothetical protein